MSIFTKIFVVLVMVMSVLLVALVVPMAANVETYRTDMDQERARRIVAEVNEANAHADLAERIGRMSSEKDDLRAEVGRLRGALSEREQTIRNQRVELVRLQSADSDVRTRLAQLSSALDQAAQINASLQDEVRERRERAVTLDRQNVELADEVRARATEVETLSRQIRLLQEENHDLRDQYEQLAERLEEPEVRVRPEVVEAGLPADVRPFDPEVTIRGRVTEVRRIGEDTFVALNVGRNDNVSRGARFTIHQDGEFLANAVVVEVDANTSAAHVTLERRTVESGAQVLAGRR